MCYTQNGLYLLSYLIEWHRFLLKLCVIPVMNYRIPLHFVFPDGLSVNGRGRFIPPIRENPAEPSRNLKIVSVLL